MNIKTSVKILPKLVYGGIGVAIVFSLWFIFRTKPVHIEEGFVTRGDFEERFLIDGKIRSKNKTTLVAYASGDMDEIELKAGDRVHKGTYITTLRWDYDKKILSPLEGVVVKVYRQSGGPINRGEPLIDIVDPNDIEIVAEPLTSDAIRIKVGAMVEVSGVGEAPFYLAQVQEVSRAGFVKISALGVEEERTEVRMAFKNAPVELLQRVGDNYHVELSIRISEEKDVLKIPLGALFKIQDRWAAYTLKNKRAHLQEIQIGKKNNREVVLISGLKEGDPVILFPGDEIFEGVRVEK